MNCRLRIFVPAGRFSILTTLRLAGTNRILPLLTSSKRPFGTRLSA